MSASSFVFQKVGADIEVVGFLSRKSSHEIKKSAKKPMNELLTAIFIVYFFIAIKFIG
jgi:hypothetical protein